MTAVENKIPNISSFVKETDYNTKVSEIQKKLTDHNHDKHITTPGFNKFTAEVFETRLAQVNLVAKKDFDTKLISFNKKFNASQTKHLLVEMTWKTTNIWFNLF